MAYKKICGENVFCPDCREEPILLCDENGDMTKPAFYICFDCKRIGEIGVGNVDFITDDDEDEKP